MGNSLKKDSRARDLPVKPTGLYQHCEWEQKTVKRLIFDRKLAPRYSGCETPENDEFEECPICFLHYPGGLNRTKCCRKGICTECHLQIKKPSVRHTVCPFCNARAYGVTFKGPLSAEEKERDKMEEQKVIAAEGRVRDEERQRDEARRKELSGESATPSPSRDYMMYFQGTDMETMQQLSEVRSNDVGASHGSRRRVRHYRRDPGRSSYSGTHRTHDITTIPVRPRRATDSVLPQPPPDPPQVPRDVLPATGDPTGLALDELEDVMLMEALRRSLADAGSGMEEGSVDGLSMSEQAQLAAVASRMLEESLRTQVENRQELFQQTSSASEASYSQDGPLRRHRHPHSRDSRDSGDAGNSGSGRGRGSAPHGLDPAAVDAWTSDPPVSPYAVASLLDGSEAPTLTDREATSLIGHPSLLSTEEADDPRTGGATSVPTATATATATGTASPASSRGALSTDAPVSPIAEECGGQELDAVHSVPLVQGASLSSPPCPEQTAPRSPRGSPSKAPSSLVQDDRSPRGSPSKAPSSLVQDGRADGTTVEDIRGDPCPQRSEAMSTPSSPQESVEPLRIGGSQESQELPSEPAGFRDAAPSASLSAPPASSRKTPTGPTIGDLIDLDCSPRNYEGDEDTGYAISSRSTGSDGCHVAGSDGCHADTNPFADDSLPLELPGLDDNDTSPFNPFDVDSFVPSAQATPEGSIIHIPVTGASSSTSNTHTSFHAENDVHSPFDDYPPVSTHHPPSRPQDSATEATSSSVSIHGAEVASTPFSCHARDRIAREDSSPAMEARSLRTSSTPTPEAPPLPTTPTSLRVRTTGRPSSSSAVPSSGASPDTLRRHSRGPHHASLPAIEPCASPLPQRTLRWEQLGTPVSPQAASAASATDSTVSTRNSTSALYEGLESYSLEDQTAIAMALSLSEQ